MLDCPQQINQDNGTHGRRHQFADEITRVVTQQAKKGPAQNRADNANDQIADHPESAPLHDLPRQSTGGQANQQEP
jgi:hypothetical protein